LSIWSLLVVVVRGGQEAVVAVLVGLEQELVYLLPQALLIPSRLVQEEMLAAQA
jgi:hypothetical protein